MNNLKRISLRALLLSFALLVSSFTHSQEQTWKVNLKDADIRAFVSQIADITGYSFVIDPRVKGKVTVVSNAEMSKDAVYEMFLSVLGVHGFAAIPGTGVIKIVQQNNAKQEASNDALFKRTPNEQIVTRVIQVNNANALELVPILRPMVAKYGHLAGVAAANALIISDHVANIKRISKIIDELDSPSKYELEVIQLQEAWVGDMVKLLEELAPSELGAAAKGKGANKFSVVADQRSNRLILRGDEPFREKMRVLIMKLDQPSSTGGKTKVVRLKHADAEEIADLLSGLMGDIVSEEAADKGNAAPKAEASVYADEGLNALVIRAEPSLLQELEGVIDELDVRRAQVLIEAAIVEIQDNTDNKLGVQWALYDQGASVPGVFTNFNEIGLSAANVIGALVDQDNDPNGDLDPTLLGSPSTGITIGIGEESRNGVSWGALVQALEGDAGANVLSTPKVITMDNQESSIIVGENIPIITGQSSSGGAGTSDPFTTIEREDVGVKLIVTPSISEGDLVRLEIEQEISGVSPSTAGADIITTKRQIKTNVLADDGETIVLGGLIRDDVQVSESKVPLLGDIPLLGNLFKSTSKVVTKQNLLVFLRPTILRDKASTRAVTEQKFDQLWQLNLETKVAQGEDEEELRAREKPTVESLYDGNSIR
ncbi:type II secretion system protein GspD [Oleiphilus sp. HI0009]|nr:MULTISPECIES: type II secretion system secretin GspD [unclassified Oleiphilus]KZX81346.1 type II secretion system protein GspD [Oleiphilus sp. HI0009]KZY63285.1 type II secretion system protein GspD [Oleiphilus sp. HI0066]KZY70802.1 type II secretion system protein GspD [Oleiphilus sp. HI0067]KZZ59522.1 type II secretion system protein GspD [Oleiphilus sp. HI0125]